MMGVPVLYQGSKYAPRPLVAIPQPAPPAPILPQVDSATLLLDLRASQLTLNDGDPVEVWPDVSGNGNDFLQAIGDKKPLYQSGGGVPYISFNEGALHQQCLESGNFADNLPSFTVFVHLKPDTGGTARTIIGKAAFDLIPERGWVAFIKSDLTGIYDQLEIYTDGSNKSQQIQLGYLTGNSQVLTFEINSVDDMKLYTDGAADSFYNPSHSGASDFSTTEVVKLGTEIVGAFYLGRIFSVLIYAPAPNATDRAAIEAWLATNP